MKRVDKHDPIQHIPLLKEEPQHEIFLHFLRVGKIFYAFEDVTKRKKKIDGYDPNNFGWLARPLNLWLWGFAGQMKRGHHGNVSLSIQSFTQVMNGNGNGNGKGSEMDTWIKSTRNRNMEKDIVHLVVTHMCFIRFYLLIWFENWWLWVSWWWGSWGAHVRINAFKGNYGVVSHIFFS